MSLFALIIKLRHAGLVLCVLVISCGKPNVVETVIYVEEEEVALTSDKKPTTKKDSGDSQTSAEKSASANNAVTSDAGQNAETLENSDPRQIGSSEGFEEETVPINNPTATPTPDSSFEPRAVYLAFKNNCMACHSGFNLEYIQKNSDSIYRSIYFGRMPKGKQNFKTSEDGKTILDWLPMPKLRSEEMLNY